MTKRDNTKMAIEERISSSDIEERYIEEFNIIRDG